MTNEAILRIRTSIPVPYTVTNATGIEKGALLSLADEMTAATAATIGCYCSGIAAAEKIASDGVVKLGVYTDGYFDMVASGAITMGAAVASASDATYPNTVYEAPVTASGAGIIGHSMGTAADEEVVMIKVNIGAGGNQIS